MKGLILCAGKGKRLRPLSYSQSKTLLPVANIPVLQYCIEKLIHLEIKDIGIVINPVQHRLMEEKIAGITHQGINISLIHQPFPKGIADAIVHAKSFINQEPFMLLLGDNLIQDSLLGLKKSIDEEHAQGALILAKVPNPQDYGVVTIAGDQIVDLEEKPLEPKSNLVMIGAYAFDSSIITAVESISPSERGEYEITDAIQWLLQQGHKLSYTVTDKHFSDVGTVDRWLDANRWMLDEKKSSISSQSVLTNCTVIPPVIIDENCIIKGSTIGPYVSISSNVVIKDCHIADSIILEGSELYNIPQKISQSIFGQFSKVNGMLGEVSSIRYVLGDKSTIAYETYIKAEKEEL